MMTTGVLPYLKNGRTFNEISPNITQVIVKFPYPSTLPFEVDYTASPCYELMFTFQVFSMNLYGWYFSNIDALIIGLMMHIIAQFKILVSAIENVTKRAENMAAHDKSSALSKVIKKITFIKYNIDCDNFIIIERVETYSETIMANLKKCINEYAYYHQEVINLVDDMEKSLNFLFLIQFIGCLLTIVVGLYQISLVPFGSSSFTNMASFSFAITFEVFMHCIYGDEISFYSAEVGKAAYNCEWIKADDRIRKNLLLMTLRCQRKCFLTFGKFSKINLVLFLSVSVTLQTILLYTK
ncbi:odorant receptor [Holotrichia oblita]|uniref:Odorant receptor n=2 Tax=Holotrichia oblita TaxID=644536 RepID=A0ACB9TEH8_HOLOL|nr:odorant receptor [Holotrichia oblita]KAI4465275.1 odorant receptor [Holotrichia oblita]